MACGQLVGIGDDTCPHCGVKQTAIRRAVRSLERALPGGLTATAVILGIQVLLFLLPVVAFGGMPGFSALDYVMKGSDAALFRLGANWGVALAQGQVWRLVSATFLHIGIMHILFNGYALWLLGRATEDLYGRGWFVGIYVVSGVAGNLLSWQAQGLAFANAGASGAIFGLIGVGIAHCMRTRFANRQLLHMLVSWAIFAFVFGFIVRADNWAHLGGFVAGGGLGLALPANVVTRRRWRRVGDAFGLAATAVVVWAFVMVALA